MNLFNYFCKCKWYSKGDPANVWSFGYCHCPERQPKPPTIALIHCLGAGCGYYTPLNTHTFTVTTSIEKEKKEMINTKKTQKEYKEDSYYGNAEWAIAYELNILNRRLKEDGKIIMNDELLKDFVAYCNTCPRTSRADHLDSLLVSYLHRKKGDV